MFLQAITLAADLLRTQTDIIKKYDGRETLLILFYC